MQIQNVTNGLIVIADLPGAQGGSGLSIEGGQIVSVYDEDAEKSNQLSSLITSGLMKKVGDLEPSSGAANADLTGRIHKWIMMNDVYAQFAEGVTGINGVGDNAYVGAHVAGATVVIYVTDGDGTQDLLNDVSTVMLTVAGGTAASPKINGGVSPVLLTFVQGRATALITASGAGTVLLTMASPTHPYLTLNAADTATVTLS